jgi:purine-cytosine permease-like protein
MEDDMPKPPSIARFERYWFPSTLFWLIGTRLAWDRTQHALTVNPQTIPVAGWAQWAIIALVVATTLLLWYLVARRASSIARWLVVLLAVIGTVRILLTLFTLATSANPHPLSQGSFIISAALTIASAAMLFRDDARLWFGDGPSEIDGNEA